MRTSSGIPDLDDLLAGLLAGDNVVWVTTNQGMAAAIERSFLLEGRDRDEPCTYVTTETGPVDPAIPAGQRAADSRCPARASSGGSTGARDEDPR